MARFDDYATKCQTVRMERREGILQMTFHTGSGPLQWGLLPHGEFPQAFRDVGSDPENKVVIITGTGDTYSGPRAAGGTGMRSTPAQWDRVYWEGKHLLMSLLDIEVPMISAINGPAWRHSEIPLLCDIVLAADDVQFQDSAHFPNGMVPGDGMHIVYPLLLGWNRGRYFLLTGQVLDAPKALELGLVSELLPRPDLLPRAWALAEQIARQGGAPPDARAEGDERVGPVRRWEPERHAGDVPCDARGDRARASAWRGPRRRQQHLDERPQRLLRRDGGAGRPDRDPHGGRFSHGRPPGRRPGGPRHQSNRLRRPDGGRAAGDRPGHVRVHGHGSQVPGAPRHSAARRRGDRRARPPHHGRGRRATRRDPALRRAQGLRAGPRHARARRALCWDA